MYFGQIIDAIHGNNVISDDDLRRAAAHDGCAQTRASLLQLSLRGGDFADRYKVIGDRLQSAIQAKFA
jgi:hypothetical protein